MSRSRINTTFFLRLPSAASRPIRTGDRSVASHLSSCLLHWQNSGPSEAKGGRWGAHPCLELLMLLARRRDVCATPSSGAIHGLWSLAPAVMNRGSRSQPRLARFSTELPAVSRPHLPYCIGLTVMVVGHCPQPAS